MIANERNKLASAEEINYKTKQNKDRELAYGTKGSKITRSPEGLGQDKGSST